MADPTAVTPANINGLPAQYQGRLNAVEQKKALAQALIKQGLTQQQGQIVGGRYISPTSANLGGLVQALAGAYSLKSANQQATQVQSDYQNDYNGQRQKITSLLNPQTNPDGSITPADPIKAEQLAQSSDNPVIQKFGDQLATQRQARLALAVGKASPTSGIAALKSDNIADAQAGTVGQPVAVYDAKGHQVGTYVTQPDGKADFVPGGGIVNNIGAKASDQILQKQADDLGEGRKVAQAAAESLPKQVAAYTALTSLPLNSGAFSSEKTAIQQLGSLVGLDVPADSANTQYYQSTVLPAITQAVHQISSRGTNIDVSLASKAAPTANLDPRAAQAIAETLIKGNVAIINNHNALVDAGKTASQNVDGFNPDQLNFYKVPVTISGGQDSSPTAQMLTRAIGGQPTPVGGITPGATPPPVNPNAPPVDPTAAPAPVLTPGTIPNPTLANRKAQTIDFSQISHLFDNPLAVPIPNLPTQIGPQQ